jgi:NAD(P)-dependent dehydrogenase (short-subunit alcohol dehydrogenase family)
VNNAGVTGRIGPFRETDPATLRRVIDVNVIGTMLCAREALARWAERGTAGVMVNIPSIAATLGSPGEYVHYAASKGTIDAFTVGLARESAPMGVRVNAVAPGTVFTDIHAAAGEPDRPARVVSRVPMGRIGEPDEIANAVLWLLSPRLSYVTGAILRVAGGL